MSDRIGQEEFDARMSAGEDPYGIVADDLRRYPRRDLDAALAECERLRAAGDELARLVRETIPLEHHRRCNSRDGGACDCYMRKYVEEAAAVAEWAALGEADN